jgi:pimeloyl-ACP methyl ester carboxylesterase
MVVSQMHHNGFGGGERVQGLVSRFPAAAGFLEPAERQLHSPTGAVGVHIDQPPPSNYTFLYIFCQAKPGVDSVVRRRGRSTPAEAAQRPVFSFFAEFSRSIDPRKEPPPAMALPALVLIHGGAHAGDCWDLTVAELARQEPQLRFLAVDLPGRGSKPANLADVTIADFVDSVVADVEDAGLGDVVVVGHSLGGLTVPGVVAKLGTRRVREMVMLSAFVPPQGRSVAQALRGPLVPLARSAGLIGRSFPMPVAAA